MARLNQTSQDDQTKWTFQQLGGERKSLVLVGKQAPLGRPRMGAVVADEIVVQEEEVYYGSDRPPTRHIFDAKHEAIEIHGRWADYYLGKGEAAKLAKYARAFVADKQQVSVAWADNLRITGLIKRIKTEREAASDIPWEMTILVDTDEQLRSSTPEPTPPTPKELIGNPLADLKLEELPRVPDTLRVGPFEALSQAMSVLAEVGAELASVAEQMRSFARAPLGLLKQFRATLQRFRTLLIESRNDLEKLPADYALETQAIADQQQWLASKSVFEAGAIATMRKLAEADRRAAIAESGKTKALYTAKGGDTFETISVQAYGSSSRANDIREANGVSAGSDPIMGTLYRIPT
jgi:nucleoid-associated protein YgaU